MQHMGCGFHNLLKSYLSKVKLYLSGLTSVNVLEFDRSITYHIQTKGVTQIVIKNHTQTLDEYTVDIEEFLKNPQTSNTITMLEATVSGPPGPSVSIGGFELDDRVLFYVPKIDGTNQYSPESFEIPKQCDAKLVLEQPKITFTNDFKMMQDETPLNDNFIANKPIKFVYNMDMRTLFGKSFDVDISISKIIGNDREIAIKENIHTESKLCEWISTASWEFVPTAGKYAMWMHTSTGNSTGGTSSNTGFNVIENISEPENVECSDDRVLVIKSSDSKPACIFPESIQKLTERGWIGNIIKIEPKIMNAIESASIKKYALEPEFEAQRDIAKQIYKSLSTGQDTPYLGMGLEDDRKSIRFAIDITKLTLEKNEEYYEKLFEEKFSGIIPYKIVFQESKGGDQ